MYNSYAEIGHQFREDLFCFYFARKILSPGPRDFVRNRGWSLTVGLADDSAMNDSAVKLWLGHSSSARHVCNRQVGIVNRRSLAKTPMTYRISIFLS
jgi:hypothetical protein